MDGFYGHLDEHGQLTKRGDIFSEEYALELIIGYQNSDVNQEKSTIINLKMNELIHMLKKQTYMQGVFSRNEVLNNKHNKLNASQIMITGLQGCKSSNNNTNKEIASNENLIFSSRYDLFFRDYKCKSRYIESLCRSEHDLRSADEIANDAGVYYVPSLGMFFEDEHDFEVYSQIQNDEQSFDDSIIPSDIVKADMKAKVTCSRIQRVKNYFNKMISKFFNGDER